MKNPNLPSEWCVKNDGSQLFKDTVIKYLNDEWICNSLCSFVGQMQSGLEMSLEELIQF